jgi:hypothetical protein
MPPESGLQKVRAFYQVCGTKIHFRLLLSTMSKFQPKAPKYSSAHVHAAVDMDSRTRNITGLR